MPEKERKWGNVMTLLKQLYIVKSITSFSLNPTLVKLLLEVNSDPDFPCIECTSLHELLKSMCSEFIKKKYIYIYKCGHNLPITESQTPMAFHHVGHAV